jgi:hypothetical protein
MRDALWLGLGLLCLGALLTLALAFATNLDWLPPEQHKGRCILYHISAFIEYVWKPFRVYCTAFVSILFFCAAIRLILYYPDAHNVMMLLLALPCILLSLLWMFFTLVLMDRNEYEATIAKGEKWH